MLIGCSNEQKSAGYVNKEIDANHNITEKTGDIDLDEADDEVEVEDITFEDYIVPSEYILQRVLNHFDTEASYHLYEFAVSNSLLEIDNWIRSESARLGGKIIERYSYNIEVNSSLDLIIEFPSKVGTRIISSYTQKNMDKQYLIIEETLFEDSVNIDQNYEDHALVLFTPLEDGTTKEIFKGMYPHQHTDIYSYYFYTDAFLKELIETGNLLNGKTLKELDYLIGYFDKDGTEIDPYTILEENVNEFTFGILLKRDFLPEGKNERERVLFHWAKTLLLGDKAYSRIFDGTEQVNFLFDGKVFKTFNLQELAE